MRVREVHFSTSMREIDLAHWCMNNLSAFGEERFYLRFHPESRDYAVPLYSAKDLRRVRGNESLCIVRLVSRSLSRSLSREHKTGLLAAVHPRSGGLPALPAAPL